MKFSNEYESLQLEIVSYELPADEGEPDSDDRNWLVLRATWNNEDGEILKDSNSCLLTYELREMTTELKVVRAGIKTGYQSDFAAPYFSLAVWAEGEETFRAAVSFFFPNSMDGDDTAEVEAVLTKDDMTGLVNELDRMCKKFPDRL